MSRRVFLTLGLLALLCGAIWPAPGWDQSSNVPQSCSPPAVTNKTSQTNADRKAQKSDGKVDVSRKVIIERIEFDRPVHLSSADIEQVIENANKNEWDADSPAWIDELTEIGLRSAWQDQGYFKIDIAAQAQPLGSDSNHERFLVAVHVINEGPQFHVGDIQFTGGRGIPEVELRRVFPLHEGEILSVTKVREGIEALTKLYSSQGYLDFTAVPDTVVDDNLQRISLVIRLDEQKQFRVGSVEIRGLDPSLEARLRSILVPGEVFNPQPVTAFLKENRPVLPRGLDNYQVRRNPRTGIADLTFDPSLCR
jgi:outer membrane protein assembly factor BamA